MRWCAFWQKELPPNPGRIRGFCRLCAKGLKIFLNEGTRSFVRKAINKFRRCRVWGEPFLAGVNPWQDINECYAIWLEKHSLDDSSLAAIENDAASLTFKPLVSIVTPVYNVEEAWLRKTIESVLAQVYSRWELCIVDDASTEPHVSFVLNAFAEQEPRIKLAFLDVNIGISGATNKAAQMAKGEFLAFLDHDDELAPTALYEVVKQLNIAKDLDLLYSDEDKIDEAGHRTEPSFKPCWSPDLLFSTNYINHLTVVRKKLFDEIGGLRPGFDGSQDYDLLLRLTERTDRIAHIPKILYHWRQIPNSTASSILVKPIAYESAQLALQQALKRRQLAGRMEALGPGRYRICHLIENEPRVSIIIPTKDKVKLLKACIASIEKKSTYANYEILVVDNNSSELDTRRYFSEIKAHHRVVAFRHPFNWSAINNFAARQCQGEYLLFLNNDVEVAEPTWLEAMLGHAQRDSVGVVGAKLLYPDRTIQHAGVMIGLGGSCDHAFKGLRADSTSYLGLADLVRNCSAVTGACMMVRRAIFAAVGGFDENLRMAGGDVDFCFRVRQRGYWVVYTPFAVLYHHESATRGILHPLDDDDYMHRQWGNLLSHGDPYYNSQLFSLFRDRR